MLCRRACRRVCCSGAAKVAASYGRCAAHCYASDPPPWSAPLPCTVGRHPGGQRRAGGRGAWQRRRLHNPAAARRAPAKRRAAAGAATQRALRVARECVLRLGLLWVPGGWGGCYQGAEGAWCTARSAPALAHSFWLAGFSHLNQPWATPFPPCRTRTEPLPRMLPPLPCSP